MGGIAEGNWIWGIAPGNSIWGTSAGSGSRGISLGTSTMGMALGSGTGGTSLGNGNGGRFAGTGNVVSESSDAMDRPGSAPQPATAMAVTADISRTARQPVRLAPTTIRSAPCSSPTTLSPARNRHPSQLVRHRKCLDSNRICSQRHPPAIRHCDVNEGHGTRNGEEPPRGQRRPCVSSRRRVRGRHHRRSRRLCGLHVAHNPRP